MIKWAEENPLKAALLGGSTISLFPAGFVSHAAAAFPSLKPEELEIVSSFFSEGIGPLQIVFFMAITFIIPPLEELVFRGWIWNLCKSKLSLHWTWVIVSLLFAAVHAEPLHILGLIPLSFFLGWLRMKTGDINASVLAHIANNAVGCLLMMV